MAADSKQDVEVLSDDIADVIEYPDDNNIPDLRRYIIYKIKENKLENVDLVSIANINSDTFNLVKELVKSNQIKDGLLVNQVAKMIVNDIEEYVDEHLKIYQKFTLNSAPMSSSISTAQFFNLISLLKDVSMLGKKLIEAAPQFNAQKPADLGKRVSSSSNLLSDNKSISSCKSRQSKKSCDEDATSEDLVAALIESSSSDDFLILTSSLESISNRDMILASLLYIKSHECFTLSHNIQSVVMVLRRTKFIILNILAPKNQMELITKLLTSIGRYSEMTYVFDLFRDRNQFEVLLSKGVEKTPELRIALFNYVKKNPEYYALVTLNFSMFREIAESLRDSAIKRLNKVNLNRQKKKEDSTTGVVTTSRPSLVESNCGLTAIATAVTTNTNDHSFLLSSTSTSSSSTTSSSSSKLNILPRNLSLSQMAAPAATTANSSPLITAPATTTATSLGTTITKKSSTTINHNKESLNLSLVELVDASDCFAKAGCYKRSEDCARKARLLALQIALITNGDETNVLDLQQSQLNDLIVNLESFQEAYIVAEAYDYHLAWRQALFKNVIIRGSSSYLSGFCKRCDLSSNLIEELVLLYKQYVNNKNNPPSQDELNGLAKAMQLVLVRLADVELRCKLYNQLNFYDAREELVRNQATEAYLKDLKLL